MKPQQKQFFPITFGAAPIRCSDLVQTHLCYTVLPVDYSTLGSLLLKPFIMETSM